MDMALKTRTFKILAFATLLVGAIALYPQITRIARQTLSSSSGPSTPPTLSEEGQNFAEGSILRQTIRYLSKNYYDTASLKPREMLKECLLGLSRNVPEIVVDIPDKGGRFTLEVNGKKKRFDIPSLNKPQDIIAPLQEAFTFVAENYQGETKFEDMEYAAINSMLSSLDPHSALLPPKVFDEFKTQTEGEFGGIGIVIGLKEGELTVIAPLPNTPAWRAGLKSKDRIVQIGEEATINMNLTEAVERLRGKVGTQVSLVLEREGAPAPIEVTLTRDNIKIESVQAKLMRDPNGDIGILRVKSFQEETLREMKRQLKEMKRQASNFKGLILDMRNNPGGLLNQAVDVADMFLNSGTIVLTVGAEDQVLEINRAHQSDADENYPLVILVNEGSASASEIVAGAIKNNDRGVIMGRQTFDKGSVQSVYALKEGAALKITVAQYLTPGKASIQSVGITPDVKLLPMTVDPKTIDILESEVFGEKDLEKHLSSHLVQDKKSVHTLEYFQPKKEEEDFDSSYTADIDTEQDFELKFARQLLLNTPGEDRDSILKGMDGLVKEVSGEEFAKLEKALAEIGIDWSLSSVSGGKPTAAVTLNLQSSEGQVLKAGEEVEIELKVHNTGDMPFYRLVASTGSESYLLKNREFIFGKLSPGETRSWKVPIKVPTNALRREDKVTFSFQEGNGNIPEKFESMVETKPVERPSYAYQMELHEDGVEGSRGDGDGIVEAGESAVLKFKVENQGKGESQKTQVNLKNLDGEGIFISNGRAKLETLRPQEIKNATLSFRVDPKFAKEKIELELLIQDNESQEVLRDKLVFPLGTADLDKRAIGIHAGPILTLEKHPYPTKTKENKISISGRVEDTSGLKDVSVYVGENKAFLKTFEDGQSGEIKESSFAAPVQLKNEENNLITIMARDKNDLTTRQSFYIYKE
jgi:carboxyl-terminal processing protease